MIKLHFTTSRPPSRVPSRIFILDEGCQVSVGNDCRNRRFRHKLDNPCQEQKFLMELLMEVLTWWNAALECTIFMASGHLLKGIQKDSERELNPFYICWSGGGLQSTFWKGFGGGTQSILKGTCNRLKDMSFIC